MLISLQILRNGMNETRTGRWDVVVVVVAVVVVVKATPRDHLSPASEPVT